ncbi:MAG: glutamine-hydrolyzing GMP synthase [Thermoplasmata archaeon]|nr:glutamine-hydrolyzing GMP synthase [Thermoplasmata archaeon]
MFDVKKFINETIRNLRNDIKGKAIIAVSGGVDSTVSAVLTHMAIGDNLLPVFIDTGLMRKNESDKVKGLFDSLNIKIKILNREEDFLKHLEGITDPEQKRKIVGERFIRNFEEEARNFNAEYLVQGTIAPDWIESGGGIRERIKTHHNVGGLPERMDLKIVEPLRDLYKDEVREIAKYLGIKNWERQPFPGPGLSIRVIGEVNKNKLDLLREATEIVENEVENAVNNNLIQRPWQYFAIMLPVKTTGVHGDKRAYGYTVAVRIIDSIDGMSGTYSRIPHEILERISINITNRIPEINRVVYDITNKPPATIEWE